MKLKRIHLQWLYPFSLMAVISIFSGRKVEVTTGVSIPFSDKLIHFLIFGLIATSIYRCITTNAQKAFKATLIALVLTCSFGLIDELHQGMTPGRSMEMPDLFADMLGALVAIYVYRLWPFYRNTLELKLPNLLKKPTCIRKKNATIKH